MIPLNSTNNFWHTCYTTGHRKDSQLPPCSAHFAGAPAPSAGQASLPLHHAHPALRAHPGQETLRGPTHPSPKKAGVRSPRYILQWAELDATLCDQGVNPGTLLIHQPGRETPSRTEGGSEMILLNRLLCRLKVLCREKRLNYRKPLSVFFKDVRLLKRLVNLAFHSEYATTHVHFNPRTASAHTRLC